MAPVQEANSDNLGKSFDFLHSDCMLSVLIRIADSNEYHKIQFHDKIRKFPYIFVFLSYRKNFVGTQKRVRISHGKRAIGVRAIEVRLYYSFVYFQKFAVRVLDSVTSIVAP